MLTLILNWDGAIVLIVLKINNNTRKGLANKVSIIRECQEIRNKSYKPVKYLIVISLKLFKDVAR